MHAAVRAAACFLLTISSAAAQTCLHTFRWAPQGSVQAFRNGVLIPTAGLTLTTRTASPVAFADQDVITYFYIREIDNPGQIPPSHYSAPIQETQTCSGDQNPPTVPDLFLGSDGFEFPAPTNGAPGGAGPQGQTGPPGPQGPASTIPGPPGPPSVQTVDTFQPAAATSTFTTSATPVGPVLVYRNGSLQVPNIAYNSTGQTVTFLGATPPTAGDTIQLVYPIAGSQPITIVRSVCQGSGGTAPNQWNCDGIELYYIGATAYIAVPAPAQATAIPACPGSVPCWQPTPPVGQ